MSYIIAEIIGAFAFITLAFSYLKKKKEEILFVQIIAYVLFTIHYYMLGGMTGSICNFLGLISLVAIYLFNKHELKNKKYLIIGIIPFFIAISLITYKDFFSIFPITASIITIASFLTNSERTIRGMGIVSVVCWLVYAVFIRSIVSTVFESITLVLVLIAFIRKEKSKE